MVPAILVRLLYRKYPHLVRAMEQRHIAYNETLRYIEAKERAGEILVLRPEAPLPVGRVEKNPANLYRAYEIGKKSARAKLELVRAFIARPAAQ